MANKKRNKKISPDSLKRRAMFEASQKEYRKCLYSVTPDCRQPAIDAHSIQKSGKLQELAEDGHVYAFHLRPMFDDPPKMPEIRSKGHREATTFAGMCNEHDSELFAPIDNSPIDLDDQEHVFLLTYRTVLKETHDALRLKRWTAEAYARLVEDGVADPDDSVSRELSAAAELGSQRMLAEKQEMDRLYLAGDHHGVGKEVIWLPEGEPALGVSAFISTNPRYGEQALCALNVFPQDGRHAVIFSFRKGCRLRVRKSFADELRYHSTKNREQVASRIVLENCEDPIFRPGVYETFTDEQRLVIRSYYWQTAMMGHVNASPMFSTELKARAAKNILDASGAIHCSDSRINLFKAVD